MELRTFDKSKKRSSRRLTRTHFTPAFLGRDQTEVVLRFEQRVHFFLGQVITVRLHHASCSTGALERDTTALLANLPGARGQWFRRIDRLSLAFKVVSSRMEPRTAHPSRDRGSSGREGQLLRALCRLSNVRRVLHACCVKHSKKRASGLFLLDGGGVPRARSEDSNDWKRPAPQ